MVVYKSKLWYRIVGTIFIAAPLTANAQTPAPTVNFTITVTAQELDTIGNGLGGMPFKDAAPLINKLREQVIAQTKPADKPVDNSEKK